MSPSEGDKLATYLQLLIVLITAGVIPYLISRNSKQHDEAKNERMQAIDELKEVKADISTQKKSIDGIQGEIIGIRKEIVTMKEDWVDDLKTFIKKESNNGQT